LNWGLLEDLRSIFNGVVDVVGKVEEDGVSWITVGQYDRRPTLLRLPIGSPD